MQAGDVAEVDFGVPRGSEAGLVRPAVLVTSSVILRQNPRTFQVVPLTTNVERNLPFELRLDSWQPPSAAQCHLLTTLDRATLTGQLLGQVGAVDLRRIRELLRDILDLDE
jgi:mRNA interferase MazF